jgi:hypothetical protein
MRVNIQVSACFDFQIKQTMNGYLRKHVVKETHAGINCEIATSIQI